jgi:hypothetical protein
MNKGKYTVKAYATGSKKKVEDEGNKWKAHEEEKREVALEWEQKWERKREDVGGLLQEHDY